jgi:hypothetical protein
MRYRGLFARFAREQRDINALFQQENHHGRISGGRCLHQRGPTFRVARSDVGAAARKLPGEIAGSRTARHHDRGGTLKIPCLDIGPRIEQNLDDLVPRAACGSHVNHPMEGGPIAIVESINRTSLGERCNNPVEVSILSGIVQCTHATRSRRRLAKGRHGRFGGMECKFGYGRDSGSPHRLQKRSAGVAVAPHFGQLTTRGPELAGGAGAGADGTLGAGGLVFGAAEGADLLEIAPTSHKAAPSTINAMLRAGVPPPKRLKIRSCIPNAGRMSETTPRKSSTAPHCWSFVFMAYRTLSLAVHMAWPSQSPRHLRQRESLRKILRAVKRARVTSVRAADRL